MEVQSFTTLIGHEDRVWNVSWSPNGQQIASCGGDKLIKIWQCNTSGIWQCIQTLTHQARTVRAVSFSPDGQRLASASFDGTIAIWKLCDTVWCHSTTLEGHESEVKDVCWNAKGTLLASCGRDRSVWIWSVPPIKKNDSTDFECISVIHQHSQDVKSICFHPTRNILVSGSYDNTINIYEENSVDKDWYCTNTLTRHQSTVWSVTFHPIHSELMTSVDSNTLLALWKFQFVENGCKIIHTENESKKSQINSCLLESIINNTSKHPIYHAAFSKNGLLATASGDDSISFYDTQKSSLFNLVKVFSCEKAHDSDVNAVAWNPIDSNIIASAGDDNLVKIWRIKP